MMHEPGLRKMTEAENRAVMGEMKGEAFTHFKVSVEQFEQCVLTIPSMQEFPFKMVFSVTNKLLNNGTL